MLLKAGVDISRLNRNIRRTLNIVNDVFYDNGAEMVITSTYEGNHSPSSLHYSNDAFDIRLPVVRIAMVVEILKSRLGKDIDVVPESNHIHVEYDPK